MAKAGDIALFRKDGSIISEIISDVTHSEYTHAALFIAEDTIVEAWWDGVKVNYLPYRGKNFDVFTPVIPFTDSQTKGLIEYAKSKVGVQYDFTALVGILIEKHLGLSNNPLAHKNKVICSEFVSGAYCYVGVDPVPTKVDDITEPGDFAKWGYLVKCS